MTSTVINTGQELGQQGKNKKNLTFDRNMDKRMVIIAMVNIQETVIPPRFGTIDHAVGIETLKIDVM